MNITGHTITDLWREATDAVLLDGRVVSPRGQKTSELLGVQLVLLDPRARVPALRERKWSIGYAMGELAWYLSGRNDLAFVQRFAPSYGRFSDDGATLNGAYGPRIFGRRCSCCFDGGTVSGHGEHVGQWEAVRSALVNDHDTRQAVISIHGIMDPGFPTKDYPCTLSLQFLRREDRLHLITTMRSNDLWLGTLYDVFCFTALQEVMANELGLELGTYTHNVGSLHLYERNVESARELLSHPAEWSGPQTPLALKPHGHDYLAKLLVEDSDTCEASSVKDLLDVVRAAGGWKTWTLLDLAAAAWRWKRLCSLPEVPEATRRAAGSALENALPSLFELVFH